MAGFASPSPPPRLVDFQIQGGKKVYRLLTDYTDNGLWREQLRHHLELKPEDPITFRLPERYDDDDGVPLVHVLLPNYVVICPYLEHDGPQDTVEVLLDYTQSVDLQSEVEDLVRIALSIPEHVDLKIYPKRHGITEALDLKDGELFEVAVGQPSHDDHSKEGHVGMPSIYEDSFSSVAQEEVFLDEDFVFVPPSEKMVECNVCCDPYPLSFLLSSPDCSHYFCHFCLYKHLENDIEAWRFMEGENGQFGVRCPLHHECKSCFNPDTVRYCLNTQGEPGLYQKYLDRLAKAKYRVECPHCHEAVDGSDLGGHVIARCSYPQCHKYFCINGCDEAHRDMTCDEYQARRQRTAEEKASEDLLREMEDRGDIFICPSPNCGQSCEKDPPKPNDPHGCDKVTCPACHRQSCFLCLADRSVVYGHDNKWHKAGCLYYQDHDDAPTRCPKWPEGGFCPLPPPMNDKEKARMVRVKAIEKAKEEQEA